MKQKEGNGRQFFLALTSAYLALISSVYLLYPGLGNYQDITAQKWKAYLLLTSLYVVAMLLLYLELKLVGGVKLPSPQSVWHSLGTPQKVVLLYLFVTALSTLFSENRQMAFWGSGRREGFLTIALYCLTFLLVSTTFKPRRWLLWLFSGAISLNCVLALIQFTGANPLRLYPEGMNYYDAYVRYSGEFLGTLGNVDVFSAVLTFSILGFLAAIVHTKKLRECLLLLIPTVMCLYVLLRAFVAGGVVGVTGGVLFSIPVLMKGKSARRIAWISVACLLILGAVCVYYLGKQLGGFLYEASELMHGRWNDNFGTGRLYIWRNVIRLVPEHPLFGGGPDTLGLRTDAAFERYDKALGILIRSEIDCAHNEYLNILINQGALSLFLYLALLGISAVRWIQIASEDSVAAICGCASLAYCIQAFFGISSPISTPFLWLALAILNPCPIRDVYSLTEEKKK